MAKNPADNGSVWVKNNDDITAVEPDMYTGEDPVQSAHKIWAIVQRDLGYALGQNVHKSWTGRLHICGADAYSVTFMAPTSFIVDKIENTYADQLRRLWNKHDVVIPPRRIIINHSGQRPAAPAPPASTTANTSHKSKSAQLGRNRTDTPSRLRPAYNTESGVPRQDKFTFDNFIVGPSNEFAYAAARQVADTHLTPYNPVIIHGRNGMGKTHLLYATQNMMRTRVPGKNVLKISGEQFVNMFVGSFQKEGREAIENFKSNLRGADVLMIDDMHFIISRPGSQEELLLTLVERLSHGRQTILTCDIHPDDMDRASPRLKSHLGGGLICKIAAPDYEMRLRVVDRLVQQRQESGFSSLNIPRDARDHLAAHVDATPRDLEGAFNQVVANAQLLGRSITLDSVQDSLAEGRFSGHTRITVERIQRAVAKAYNITMDDMVSKRRSRSIARPRQVAMFLAKKLTTRSLPDIGRRFGGRDHSTVIHAVKKISEICSEDDDFARKVDAVENMIKSGG